MTRQQAIPLGLTALIAALIFLWLRLAYVHIYEQHGNWPPRHDGEVVFIQDNFFEVVEEMPVTAVADEEAAAVENEIPADNASVPAPASGTDTHDNGPAAEAPATTTAKEPSPVKAQPKPPTNVGPTQEEINARQEAEARRKSTAAMNSAFNRPGGTDNTANNGTTPGDSGTPTGLSASINGTGSGTVGGGWFMPSYAKVPSTVTGSIRMRVRIDSEGQVVEVAFQGGDPPAATDPELRRAVESEVRSRRFTRGASPAPNEATAYITYRFR